MAHGYADNMTAAERALSLALTHVANASASETRDVRGQHIGWAIALAEEASRCLMSADVAYTKIHTDRGPLMSYLNALSGAQRSELSTQLRDEPLNRVAVKIARMALKPTAKEADRD